MSNEVSSYIEKYSEDTQYMFNIIKKLIYETVSCEINEKLWAKIPSYYVEDRFIRIIPFKDHINIEAAAVLDYKDKLDGYKITPKGMLQISINQDIPNDLLKLVIEKTLSI